MAGWSGFHLNRGAWATADVSTPSAVSTAAPTYMVPIEGSDCVRIQFVGQGADNATSGAIVLYAISVDSFVDPKVYMASLLYTVVTSATLSAATVTDVPQMGRSGVIRWVDTLTNGATTASIILATGEAFSDDADAVSTGYHAGSDSPAELMFGGLKGFYGIAWSAVVSNFTAFNVLVNHGC